MSMTRRSSISSSFSSALAKRSAMENFGKVPSAAASTQQAKKRVALGDLKNLTNQADVGRNLGRLLPTKTANKANASSSASSVKKRPDTSVRDKGLHRTAAIAEAAAKATTTSTTTSALLPVNDEPTPAVHASLAPCSTVISPNRSGDSVSMDESMSTCGSMKSPDFEYVDNEDFSTVASLERRASNNLHISEQADATGCTWKRDVPIVMETTDDSIFDVDKNHEDPQLCATLACDIYRHLRMAETKKRPSTDFMEKVQKDINASMRSILVDWLVEVSEEYRLVPDTLYMTVNYIDRYLSGNEINRQRLQLLGVACMLIAAKYEEICAPQVEEFCYITDNTYFKDEVLQMEADVLKYLKFEMTAPTAKCFLRRFSRVAQGPDEVPLLRLEFLANYIAELSLLEYDMLCYSPSLIAASSVFLAKFIFQPSVKPWNAMLGHYTQYRPSELCDCVKALHHLFCNSARNNLPAIREKYSHHKHKFVAKEACPPSIPPEFFQDPSS